MKKIILLIIAASPLLLQAQLVKTLKKSTELKMPGIPTPSLVTGEDSLPGKRGAAVLWHPVQKKYYAAFAGNYTFPLAVFDASGKRLSGEELNCMIDLRGLWYNPKLKKICGNGHSDIGWFSYKLDLKGIPVESEIYAEGMNQPGEQSIGALNTKTNMVCFLEGQNVYVYNADAMREEDSTVRLYPGIAKEADIDEDDNGEFLSEDYNYNALIYTGISKAEFGLLNFIENQIELYNKKTGLLTQKLKLPVDATSEPSFNFSYTNGIYWLFDMENRKWVGYK